MKLVDYREGLLKELQDPEFAAEYLEQILESGDKAAFLIGLKDVVDAGGGVSSIAARARLTRPSLYKALSKNGNPTLQTLQKILKPLGLRVAIELDQVA